MKDSNFRYTVNAIFWCVIVCFLLHSCASCFHKEPPTIIIHEPAAKK